MSIRFARKEDAEGVIHLLDELLACVLRNRNQPQTPPPNFEIRQKIFLDMLQREDVKIFIVEDRGGVVAMADVMLLPIMRRGKTYAHIEDFVVTEQRRGEGIGGKLLEHIKDYCRQNGIGVIKLTSGLELPDTHAFYEKHGGVYTEKMFRFNL